MTGQGSGGNVLAALCSFFYPGFGSVASGTFAHCPFPIFFGGHPVVYLDGLGDSPVVGFERGPMETRRLRGTQVKIDAAEIRYVELPLIAPWRTAYGEDATIHSVMV